MAESGSQTPVDGGTGGVSPDCEQGMGVSRGSYAENLESSADVNPAMSVTSKVSRSRSALTSIRRFFRCVRVGSGTRISGVKLVGM